MANNTLYIGIVVVIILVLVVYYITSNIATSGGSKTPVLLTDPPNVPPGTSAMVISYSSVMVHTTGASSSGWVQASGSGSANLVALTNGSSQVIAYADVPANSTIDEVKFYVNSATITVNGTAHAVAVANQTMTAQTQGSTKANATTAVIVDMSPTVSGHYNSTTNSTSNYTMTATTRAYVSANIDVSVSTQVGAVENLNASVLGRLGIG